MVTSQRPHARPGKTSIDKRTDGLDNLRSCYLVLEFRNLFPIELRKIWVDRNLTALLLGPQISIDLSLASFQAPQLITYGVRVSVAPRYEVEAAFDATLNILPFF